MTQKFDAITLRLLESLFTINERPCSEAIEMIAQRIKSDFTTVAHWFDVKRNRSQQFEEKNRASSLMRINHQAKIKRNKPQQFEEKNRSSSLLRINHQTGIKRNRSQQFEEKNQASSLLRSNQQTRIKRKEKIYDNQHDDDNITTPSNNSINTCNNNKRLNYTKNHRTSTESSSADSSTNSNMILPFDASQLLKHLKQQLMQQQQLHQQQSEGNNKSIFDDSYDLDDRLEDDLQPDVPLNDIDYYASSNSAAPSADCEDYDDMDIQDYSFEEIAAVSEMVRHRRMTMGLSQTKASQSFRAFTGGQCEFGDNFIAQFESMQAEQQTAKWALRSFGPWLDYIEGELSLGRELLFMAHDDPTRTARRREGRVFTFSEYQRTILENCFSESQYLTPEQFDELSRTIRVPNKSLKTWFKNRRSKQRSQSKVSKTNVESCNKFVVH